VNPSAPAITELFKRAGNGDAAASQALFTGVYAELRRLARCQLAGRGERTINTTGLVHECYLRLAGSDGDVRDRGHFFALAARVMRQVIVDAARERMAGKRGAGERPLALDGIDVAEARDATELIEISDLLDRLDHHEPRLARVVECRFFAGLTEPETALALGISERSVQRDWVTARTWLLEHSG
jgi:RNA polymerase sigma factor (TIGR02999 family)